MCSDRGVAPGPLHAWSFALADDAQTEVFVALISQHDRAIRRYVRTLVIDRAAVDDVMQEVTVELWRKFSTYDPAQPFVNWAYGFARHKVFKYREKQARQPRRLSDEAVRLLADEHPDHDPLLERRREALPRCIEKLNDDDRRLLRARYAGPINLAQLAQVTGSDAKSLYRALDRIRHALLRCIDRAMATDGAGGTGGDARS